MSLIERLTVVIAFHLFPYKHFKAYYEYGIVCAIDTLAFSTSVLAAASLGGKGRPRAEWQLEVAEEEIAELFHSLVPHRPPFVYTYGSD